ncbi:MAG TPA: GNAT family N-acetyltransferase [Dongiaceae bacterium]|jgi:GNAT superfamily N-acetyltransferase|nr:GNAT family N-acetyltransferase [Dongiaceae bacterium]
MTIAIRSLTAADADSIIAMHDAFTAYLLAMGDPDAEVQHFTRERYLKDGFGPDPVFAGYIAEEAGAPRGYLLYFKGYNVDLAVRMFFICDLWVEPDTRGKGIGRRLVSRCAADCRAWGGEWLEWYVYRPNKMAFDFYRKLGGRESDGLAVMTMRADSL